MKTNKLQPNKADTGRKGGMSKAAKASLAIIGIGFVAGTTIVIGVDRIMKKIFINEEWPDEDWTNDDWAGEEIDN
ncbi:MAG TPA: hypothetical protein VJY37_00730 [Anaerovoracaceae bacterium]|nr:hypothetical protein [Anaerovoracaceae bacterium]